MPKKAVSYRLTEEDKQIIELLAQHFGVSETDIIKLAIRKLAKAEGVKKEK